MFNSLDYKKVRALILDIDGTLYTNNDYLEAQNRVQIEAFAKERGLSYDEAIQKLSEFRSDYAKKHNGAKTSLANSLLAFGVSIEQSIAWRKEFVKPDDYLTVDEELKTALNRIKTKYIVCSVTNNPQEIGRKTLAALGIEGSFNFVVGLDDSGASKPHPASFEIALKKILLLDSTIKTENCISIGDRYDVDLSIPEEMGMQTALVRGSKDVIEILSHLA